MSWRSVMGAASRLALVMSVAISGVSFTIDDAEARRGGKVRTIKERMSDQDSPASKRKPDGDHDARGADDHGGTYVPGVRVRSHEAARGAETATDADATSARRRPPARAMSVRPLQDLDVPGCPTGMICTVCLAGCQSDVGGIVNAQPKTPLPERRY
jgi:hypothetical protein